MVSLPWNYGAFRSIKDSKRPPPNSPGSAEANSTSVCQSLPHKLSANSPGKTMHSPLCAYTTDSAHNSQITRNHSVPRPTQSQSVALLAQPISIFTSPRSQGIYKNAHPPPPFTSQNTPTTLLAPSQTTPPAPRSPGTPPQPGSRSSAARRPPSTQTPRVATSQPCTRGRCCSPCTPARTAPPTAGTGCATGRIHPLGSHVSWINSSSAGGRGGGTGPVDVGGPLGPAAGYAVDVVGSRAPREESGGEAVRELAVADLLLVLQRVVSRAEGVRVFRR